MKILIDYKPPCSKEILSSYGNLEYISKNLTIVVLETNKSIQEIKKINGVVTAYEERRGLVY